MRKVDRNSLQGPPSLIMQGQAGDLERQKARAAYRNWQTTSKAFTFNAYSAADVRQVLEGLFHGKCAYCESRYAVTGPVDVEHFRPKGRVEGAPDHPGYWWLAAEWTNLLPSCIDCNRRRRQKTPKADARLEAMDDERAYRTMLSGKKDCFPLAENGVRMSGEPGDPVAARAAMEAERALLINPCEDDPSEHIAFHVDAGGSLTEGRLFRQIALAYPRAVGEGRAADPALPDDDPDAAAVADHAARRALSVRGAVSIQLYGLNRLALVQERTRVLRQLELLGFQVVELMLVAQDLKTLAATAEIAALPPSGRVKVKGGILDAARRIEAAADRALGEIRRMTTDDAPFSVMARAWVATYLADLEP